MTAPPPPRLPPALMDELVEEILLRVLRNQPACLVCAALVCKRWCRLVTDPGFRRRFRQFHCTAPMLGQIVCRRSCGTQFLPSSSFRPSDADCSSWCPVDARHGRILFYDYYDDPDCKNSRYKVLIVWTPATCEVRKLPMLPLPSSLISRWNAALLCVAPGCDHMECPSAGHFNVILVSGDLLWQLNYAYIWSSEDDEWRKTDTTQPAEFVPQLCTCSCSALVRNALYFLLEDNQRIQEYNLAKKELSIIGLPPICNDESAKNVVMSVDDGGRLGFAMVRDFSLCIWLRESVPTPSGGWTWTQHKVVDINSFLPVSALSSSPYIVAAADDVGIFVIWAGDAGVLAIDLKSSQVKKVSDGDDVVNIIPYMSFCTPALRATSINEEPSTGASTNA